MPEPWCGQKYSCDEAGEALVLSLRLQKEPAFQHRQGTNWERFRWLQKTCSALMTDNQEMATQMRKRRIPGERHETALGLHDRGFISKRRMGEFEAPVEDVFSYEE